MGVPPPAWECNATNSTAWGSTRRSHGGKRANPDPEKPGVGERKGEGKAPLLHKTQKPLTLTQRPRCSLMDRPNVRSKGGENGRDTDSAA